MKESLSERGSFVTSHVTCETCLARLRTALVKETEDFYGTELQLPVGGVFAGRVGRAYPLSELVIFEHEIFFNRTLLPCHDVGLAVICKNGIVGILRVGPSGAVITQTIYSNMKGGQT